MWQRLYWAERVTVECLALLLTSTIPPRIGQHAVDFDDVPE